MKRNINMSVLDISHNKKKITLPTPKKEPKEKD
jgi:hypothetical protein